MSDWGGRGRGGAARGGGRDRGGFQGGFGGSRGGGSDRGGRGGGFRGGRGGAPPNDSRSKVFSYDGGVPSPDAAVTSFEDKIVKSKTPMINITGKMGSLSLDQQDSPSNIFPYRPAFGSAGKHVILWVNYYSVQIKKAYYYKYEVEFKGVGKEGVQEGKAQHGQKDVKGRKQHLAMEQVLNELRSVHQEVALASQFKNHIISTKKLELHANPLSIQIPPESEEQTADTVSATIHGPTEIPLADLISYFRSMDDRGERTTYPKFPDVIDALDIILGHNARSKLGEITPLGGSRLFPFGQDKKTASLMQNSRALLAARGFFQSVRISTGRLMLNTNVTHGVFKISGKLDQVMNTLRIQSVSQNDYRLKRLVAAFAKFLPKTRVWVTFAVDNGKKVRRSKALHGMVNKLMGNMAEGPNRPQIEPGWEYPGPRNIKFWLTDDNRYITVHDYYKKKYGMNLQDLPVMNLGTAKRPTFYPAEMLEIQQGQSIKAKLTADETTAMLTFACRTPYENALSIAQDARDVLDYDNNKTLEDFGITIGKKLATVNARVLTIPAVAYIDAARKPATVSPYNGSWNMRSVKVVKPGTAINKWTYINILQHENDVNRQIPKSTMENFAGFMARDMGINIARSPVDLPKTNMTYDRAMFHNGLENFFGWATSNGIQHIMFIIPQKDSTGLYTKIKRLGDCQFGIHTTCMVAKHLAKEKNLSYYSNVGLKINLKAGGVNHKLKDDFGLLKEGQTMFAGYDVTHPTNMNVTKGNEPPSLVGLVASVDRDLAQWPAIAWEQKAKQEMLDTSLTDAFKSRIRLWQAKNSRALPENIVIFRDGVSDGQFAQVIAQELPMIREACRQMYTKKQPKLSIIVSVKRHQTRFYPTNKEEMSRSGNIKNGTVVDRGITLAPYWDFFLTAHDALQGTARPAHYTVLLDEVFRSKFGERAANELERLTHELCYLYGRATKAVSICPPAYYADIVCERARAHRPEYDVSDAESVVTSSTESSAATVRQVHRNLQDTMYYM